MWISTGHSNPVQALAGVHEPVRRASGEQIFISTGPQDIHVCGQLAPQRQRLQHICILWKVTDNTRVVAGGKEKDDRYDEDILREEPTINLRRNELILEKRKKKRRKVEKNLGGVRVTELRAVLSVADLQ
jgi:hypothetical protein